MSIIRTTYVPYTNMQDHWWKNKTYKVTAETSQDSKDPIALVATFYTQKKRFQPRGKFASGQSRSPISNPTYGKHRIPKSAWQSNVWRRTSGRSESNASLQWESWFFIARSLRERARKSHSTTPESRQIRGRGWHFWNYLRRGFLFQCRTQEKFPTCQRWMTMILRICKTDQRQMYCLHVQTILSRKQTNSLILKWSLPLWTASQQYFWIPSLFSRRPGQWLLLCLLFKVVCFLGCVCWKLYYHPLLSEETSPDFSIRRIHADVFYLESDEVGSVSDSMFHIAIQAALLILRRFIHTIWNNDCHIEYDCCHSFAVWCASSELWTSDTRKCNKIAFDCC